MLYNLPFWFHLLLLRLNLLTTHMSFKHQVTVLIWTRVAGCVPCPPLVQCPDLNLWQTADLWSVGRKIRFYEGLCEYLCFLDLPLLCLWTRAVVFNDTFHLSSPQMWTSARPSLAYVKEETVSTQWDRLSVNVRQVTSSMRSHSTVKVRIQPFISLFWRTENYIWFSLSLSLPHMTSCLVFTLESKGFPTFLNHGTCISSGKTTWHTTRQ